MISVSDVTVAITEFAKDPLNGLAKLVSLFKPGFNSLVDKVKSSLTKLSDLELKALYEKGMSVFAKAQNDPENCTDECKDFLKSVFLSNPELPLLFSQVLEEGGLESDDEVSE